MTVSASPSSMRVRRAASRSYTGRDLRRERVQICTRCIYDQTTPAISFDEQGVCNYCRMVEQLQHDFNTGTPEGEQAIQAIVDRIKWEGRNKKYDCVVGVSGGTDSSYTLVKAIEFGLRPLAVHYDNTWNTAIATENIRKMLAKLDVDLDTHVVDNQESDDIFKSFFLAGVPELDGPTDIALVEVLYRAAAKFGVKYILEGHSFMTEGVSPLSNAYVDGAYIAGIHRQFGTMKMRTFPNMPFWTFMKWILVSRIKRVRPLWYLSYSKEQAREFLKSEFDWEYYGGHHLENRMTAFHHSYFTPIKFGVDQRNNSLSASVRSGQMSREDAIDAYSRPPHIEDELVDYFKKRLALTDDEFTRIMNGPHKSYRDYTTSKATFERLRPFFYILQARQLVPRSFYIKYCSKSEI